MTQITHTLNANIRDLVGKKAKRLRLSGNIIGTLYGQQKDSVTISIAFADFMKTYKEVGTTGVISLVIDKKPEPVMIHHVERHAVDASILNVEF
jgi:ribosomal protein L25 (general stress protein Ctc)